MAVKTAHAEQIVGFDSINAAEREVATATAEIRRDPLPNGDSREVTAELKNEHRQRMLTVPVTVSVETHRVNPEPLPRTRETILGETPISVWVELARVASSIASAVLLLARRRLTDAN